MNAKHYIQKNSQGRCIFKMSGRRKRIKKARQDAKMAKFWSGIFIAAFDCARELENPTPSIQGEGRYRQQVRKTPDPEMASKLRIATSKIMEGLAR